MVQYLKYTLLLFFSLLVARPLVAQKPTTFQWDTLTYGMYQREAWRELYQAGHQALTQGEDFYYLRLRMGVAKFKEGQYLSALRQFEKAAAFNTDRVVLEYLYRCNLALNRWQEALAVRTHFPASLKEQYPQEVKTLLLVNLESGMWLTNDRDQADQLNKDGHRHIYGETVLTSGGNYFGMGLEHRLGKRTALYYSFNRVTLDKEHRFKRNDRIIYQAEFSVNQEHYYLSVNHYLGKHWRLTGSANLIHLSFNNPVAQYNPQMDDYTFDIHPFDDFGVLLNGGLEKDFHWLKVGIQGAYLDLSKQQSWQLGGALTCYPLGDYRLYLYSALWWNQKDHDEGWVSEALVGGELFSKTWLNVSACFGEIQSFSEQNGYTIYNVSDKINSKFTAKIHRLFGAHLDISLEYRYFYREGTQIQYILNSVQEPVELFEKWNYQHQFIIGGLKWYF